MIFCALLIENHPLNHLRSAGSCVGTARSVPHSIIYLNQRGSPFRC